MNKPDILPMLPNQPSTGSSVASTPHALVKQSAPVSAAAHQAIPPTRPAQHTSAAPYVDPYLFETGYYTSRVEQEELSRTASTRIQLRADIENARPKARPRLKN